MDTKLSDILNKKRSNNIFISKQATLAECINAMVKNHVGALLISDGVKFEGIVSERDIINALSRNFENYQSIRASDVMRMDVQVASPDTTVSEAMVIVTNTYNRHIPVCEGSKLIGIISIGDLTKSSLEAQGEEIGMLRNYIYGNTE